RLIQVDAEPGEETVSQSVNFSIPGSRAQRNRIQIVENDFPPLSPRVRSRMIYAEACAHHLPKLVGGGIGSAAAGVSELFSLRCERAAPFHPDRQSDFVSCVRQTRLTQPAPVHDGISRRRVKVFQLTILHEQ